MGCFAGKPLIGGPHQNEATSVPEKYQGSLKVRGPSTSVTFDKRLDPLDLDSLSLIRYLAAISLAITIF